MACEGLDFLLLTRCYNFARSFFAGCTKEFSRADKLKAHIIAHAGAKPHRCQTCGRMFTRRPHLRVHERCHDDRCRYWCERCNQGFIKQTQLAHHSCTGDSSSSPTRPLRRRVGRPRKTTQPPPSTALSDECKARMLLLALHYVTVYCRCLLVHTATAS